MSIEAARDVIARVLTEYDRVATEDIYDYRDAASAVLAALSVAGWRLTRVGRRFGEDIVHEEIERKRAGE